MQMYQGDDRVKQVNWLRREADNITGYGEGTASELVDFWWSQHEAGEFDLPVWFDDVDKGLLVEFVQEIIGE